VNRSLHPSWRIIGLSLGLALGILSGPAMVAGQDAAECPLPPLTLPLFAATPAAEVAATPVDASAAPALDAAGAEMAMTVIVSCANSGETAVAYSIFTERYLASLFADPTQTYQPAFELEIASGVTQPEGTLELVSIDSVTTLPDGRTEVVAIIDSASATYTDTFVLVSLDGNWLIDDVTNFDPAR